MFEVEKLALKYCEQYNILDSDKRREDIINAFCVGHSIGIGKTQEFCEDCNKKVFAEPYNDKGLSVCVECGQFTKPF